MKRPTQADVARLAGVSTATVSYVINDRTGGRVPISEETRQRVLDAIAQLGYQPDARARSLRSGGTETIGLLIPDLHNPHYWAIIRGVEEESWDAGYELLLSSTSLEPEREVQTLRALSRRRIDALILILSYSGQSGQVLQQLIQQRYAMVAVGSSTPCDLDTVVSTYTAGTEQVMSHLLALGHRRIGLIHGVASPELGTNRLAIYQRVLREAGLPVDEALIDHCGSKMEDGYQAALRLLAQTPRPTALLVINDLLAMGALRAAAELGLRVPADLSVASFDDIDMAAYTIPPLTTVRANAAEMGRVAVRLALERLKEPHRPLQEVHVETQLIVRGSTGPAPAGITIDN